MNKSVAFLRACVAGVGLLILGRSTFLTIAYGHGNPEAGNFNRCWYSYKVDRQHGKVVREWDVLAESTEDSTVDRVARVFNMWLVGLTFVLSGAVCFVFFHRFRH